MDKVGGKGNEKTASDRPGVRTPVGVFWFSSPSEIANPRKRLAGDPGEDAKLVSRTFSQPGSWGCPRIRGPCERQASAPPPQGPYPSHTPSHDTHAINLADRRRSHAHTPAPRTRGPCRQAPSLALPPPPAAEAPDGGFLRSTRGPQTPPGSSRRSLPPSQLLRRRGGEPDRFARQTGSSASSHWGGSVAAGGAGMPRDPRELRSG